jgi:hypothetical protein
MMRGLAFSLLLVMAAGTIVAAQAPRTAPPLRPTVPAGTPPTLQIHLDGGIPVTSTFINQDFSPEINGESASITNEIELRGGGFVDGGVAFRVGRVLWAGGTVSLIRRTAGSELRALIPHPLYFDQPRTIEATLDTLDSTETNIHGAIGYQQRLSPTADITFFGGPSVFRIAQAVVTDVRYDSTYPFDTATFASATTDTASATLFGFNAGARVSYRVARGWAIAGLIRYERGTGTIAAGDGNDAQATAGGLKAGVGVRVSFCSSRPVAPRRRGSLLLC